MCMNMVKMNCTNYQLCGLTDGVLQLRIYSGHLPKMVISAILQHEGCYKHCVTIVYCIMSTYSVCFGSTQWPGKIVLPGTQLILYCGIQPHHSFLEFPQQPCSSWGTVEEMPGYHSPLLVFSEDEVSCSTLSEGTWIGKFNLWDGKVSCSVLSDYGLEDSTYPAS